MRERRQRELVDLADVLVRVGCGVVDALAAEVPLRLAAGVQLRLAAVELDLAPHVGGVVEDEDRCAALVLDPLAAAVDEEDAVRVGVGDGLAVRVRLDGLAVLAELEEEVVAVVADDGVAVLDVLVAEANLDVAVAVEQLERDRDLEVDVAVEP